MIKILGGLNDLKSWVADLALRVGDRQLILLSGPMGVGKSQLVAFLVQELNGRESSSPTYAIHHRYQLKNGGILDHVDLYRVENEDDLESTGLWDLFDSEKGIVVVEWADRLPQSIWPPNWPRIEIRLDFENEDKGRRLTANF